MRVLANVTFSPTGRSVGTEPKECVETLWWIDQLKSIKIK